MLDKNSESHVHVEAIEEPPPPGKSIAFGLERMGLIAVKAPILSMIILAALIVGIAALVVVSDGRHTGAKPGRALRKGR